MSADSKDKNFHNIGIVRDSIYFFLPIFTVIFQVAVLSIVMSPQASANSGARFSTGSIPNSNLYRCIADQV